MVAVVAVAVDVEDLGMPWRERERGERKGAPMSTSTAP